MPKYQWYFVNKDDDVCKHVTYKITLIIYFLAYSNPLTLFTVLNIFFKLMLISCLTYEILYS